MRPADVRRTPLSLARTLSASLLAALAACGGGGGSSGGPPAGGTGFIPAPGVLGATLYARGTDVRPVRAGAKWVYHRNDYSLGGDLTVTNSAVAAAGTSVIETSSDDPTSHTTVSVDAIGSVLVSAPLSLDGAHTFTVGGFELRSPVRVNDQYVIFDGDVANIDADGDGKPDHVQLAFWRVVVGNEPVDLPNRAAPTIALRVDTFVTIKLTPSGGAAAVQSSASTSAWYEPGVGIVRQTVASSSASRALDADDVLTGWDGVTEGRGYITQPQQSVDATTSMRSAVAAVGVPTGALVFTASGLHRLDKNGVLQATLPNPPIAGSFNLLRSGAGVRALAGFPPAMQLHSLDDQGQYVGLAGSFNFSNERASLVSETNWTFGAHPGGPWIWVAWQRSFNALPGQVLSEIVVRAVGGDGVSTIPERTFAVASNVQPGSVRVSAQPGGAVVTWSELDTSSITTARAALVTNVGVVQFDASPIVQAGTFPGTVGVAVPISDGTTTWLAWTNGLPTSVPGTLMQQPYGVQLDAAGNGLGAPASAALPAAVDATFIDWPAGVVADSAHLFATGMAFGLAFPNDHQQKTMMTFADYAAGAGPLASTINKAATYRVPGVNKDPSNPPIVFADRILVLSQTGSFYLQPTVVWR